MDTRVEITAETKKRPAESEGGPPDPIHIRQSISTVLGLATEGELRTTALEVWKTYTPKKNQRTLELDDLMENGVSCFIPGPIIDNTVELLKFMQKNTVGAIVTGHKMGGKSQTLQFVQQLLKSYGCGVLKFSMKDTGGPDQRPSTHQSFFRSLFTKVLSSNDYAIKTACWCLLNDVFNLCEGDEVAKLRHVEEHYTEPFGILPSWGEAESGQLAMAVLRYYNLVRNRHNFTEDNILDLCGNLFELLRRDDFGKYLLRPCVLIVDEVGDLLTVSGLSGQARMIADTYIMPLISMLSEQNWGAEHSRFYVLVAGSRSVATYAQRKHLQKFHFCLKTFDSADCVALWKMWKANLKKDDNLDEAEQWLLDVASTDSTSAATDALGDSVVMRTDGVPGYVTELFRVAIGQEPSPNATLVAVVKRCFSDLENNLALGGKPGAKVALECMENGDWVKFAEYGLTPSEEKPPSAPVLSLLFNLLRSELQDGSAAYTSMLTSMANLRLSGSFTGAVYQEQVMNSVLQGETIFAREVVWNPAKSTWQRGAQKVLVTGTPCTFYVYKKGGGGLRSPVHIGHDNLSAIDRTTAKHNPTLVVFFAESQTFPSIDFTICIKTEGTGSSEARVDMYHSSVSIDTIHFAKACTAKSSGHLPLSIDHVPPALLRSDRSKEQIAAYYATLMEHDWVTDCSVVHHYAVFNDNASDILSPTPPFQDSYRILSTKHDLAP